MVKVLIKKLFLSKKKNTEISVIHLCMYARVKFYRNLFNCEYLGRERVRYYSFWTNRQIFLE